MNESLPPIILSARDVVRVERLLAGASARGLETRAVLERELERAEVREPADIPADVVTMNSEVLCTDLSQGTERRLRLVYPDQADAAQGRVSVLSPVGAALLGLRAGGEIDWPLPGGRATRIRVQAVTWQPEAAGLPE